jgi:hypothetical protein
LRNKVNKPAVAAVIAERNGTYTVLRCSAREDEPADFRPIERRYPGFSCYGAAVERADQIEGRVERGATNPNHKK